MIFLKFLFRLFLLGILGATWLVAGVYLYLSPGLPDVETLRDVKLQTPMRVYTRDGELIGQFGEQKRSPLPYKKIPTQFVEALLAAEDDAFFRHGGIDFMGLARAVSELLLTGEKGSGGSTLTMQVARNYFLSFERTFIRKFNEILLAVEIERTLGKREIFELYFNRVFLGHRAYGFEAAAQVYYGKSIGELSLAQHAMLAGIPKAPSRNNPLSNPDAGRERRNWILGRMHTLGFVDSDSYRQALQEPVSAQQHGARIAFAAHYAAEMARQEMLQRYGMAAYSSGYHVYTTIDSQLQQVARSAIIDGLLSYDQRHGYRGPERHIEVSAGGDGSAWRSALQETAVIAGLEPAIVTAVNDEQQSAELLLRDGSTTSLPFASGIADAKPYRSENYTGPAPQKVSDVLAVGDLIRLRRDAEEQWQLSQIPAAQAALVSLDPDNGAILSIVGGMGFELSKFNRATQAERQPGSNFKPFVYAAALENGFTAASIINDAPVVLQDASLEDIWRPQNDGGRFYGPTRLRWALTKSRNLVSIRLLQRLGVDKLMRYMRQLGIDTAGITPDLSLALGTLTMTPMEVASAYAILANGGFRVTPHLIQRVENLDGEILFTARPATVCRDCGPGRQSGENTAGGELSMEQILAGDAGDRLPTPPRVMDERVAFIMNSILADVIKRGTGRRALALERSDIGGKTGTTNGPMDAWFSGYNRDVVTSTWLGFDQHTPLGRREFGGTAALPIWIDFMREALADSPETERPLPPGIVTVRIDPATGLLAPVAQSDAIFEYFREEHVPTRSAGGESRGSDSSSEELIRGIF